MRVPFLVLALILLMAMGIAGPPPALADCSNGHAAIVAQMQPGTAVTPSIIYTGGETDRAVIANSPTQSGDPPGLPAAALKDSNFLSTSVALAGAAGGYVFESYTEWRIHAGGYAGGI
ncbi:MAG: hypothetical protein HY474_02045 [Candidatus Sungbacteria bacterium]|uniref:Uncharacterized protein n=1 Tax=Candidatus Sungiibacteriota bacterium TaxID=2750080 RepID=A0A932YVU8_9BACT|nr:hypothetical protein [Candidatus Sungbacteria bacterium]